MKGARHRVKKGMRPRFKAKPSAVKLKLVRDMFAPKSWQKDPWVPDPEGLTPIRRSEWLLRRRKKR